MHRPVRRAPDRKHAGPRRTPSIIVRLLAVSVWTHCTGAIATQHALERLGVFASSPSAGALRWAASLAWWAANLAIFPAIGRLVVLDAPRPRLVAQVLERLYLAHWSAAFLTLFPLVPAALVAAIMAALGTAHAGFFAPLAFAVHAPLLVAGLVGTALAMRFRVDRSVLAHAAVPRAFHGYRIAHLSDLHVGTWTTELAESWVRSTNALEADLVVVTGDLVTSGDRWLERIAEVVGSMRAKDGVLVCLGNHDWFADGERLTELLRARGVRVLRNESVAFERGGERLVVAGVDDTWTGRANLDEALATEHGLPQILLAHDPDLFRAAVVKGVPITLSGHTHGGQVGLPFFPRLLNVSMLAHDYHLGLYRRDESLLYVSPGLGTSGPPVRLGVPAAIVLHELRG
jgi:predicted MPP superfamily phosphohydrolase